MNPLKNEENPLFKRFNNLNLKNRMREDSPEISFDGKYENKVLQKWFLYLFGIYFLQWSYDSFEYGNRISRRKVVLVGERNVDGLNIKFV